MQRALSKANDYEIDLGDDLLSLGARDTLIHLIQKSISENSRQALVSDLGYIDAWFQSFYDTGIDLPTPRVKILEFIAHHLFDPEQDGHGMPHVVESELRAARLLRSKLPQSSSTVARRLSSWAKFHDLKGVPHELGSGDVRRALRAARRALNRPTVRKSETAVTAEVLNKILEPIGKVRPVDLRDRALLSVAFASGGRRRSEIASLRFSQVREEPSPQHSFSISLGRHKTSGDNVDTRVFVSGKAGSALYDWMKYLISRVGRNDGSIFSKISRAGTVGKYELTGQSVNNILKKRAAAVGIDPTKLSAHGLRAGYLTTALNQAIPLEQAMQQSQHKSRDVAGRYYNEAHGVKSNISRLLDT